MDGLPPVLFYAAGFLTLVLFAYQVSKVLSGWGPPPRDPPGPGAQA